MGLAKLKQVFNQRKSKVEVSDPQSNPLEEKVCATIPVVIDEQDEQLVYRWILNAQGEVKGAKTTFKYRGETIPVVTSSPTHESFSMGVNIGLHESLLPKLRDELARLQEKGEVSAKAKLSYNAETKQAILFRRSDAHIPKGDTLRWRTVVQGNSQALVDDFIALMPFIMNIYGE